MFPNRLRPSHGVFVKERLRHVAEKIDLTMVAPVPSFPLMELTGKYRGLGALEEEESIDGLRVLHPRYFMIPKYLKVLDASFYRRSLAPYMEGLAKEQGAQLLDFHWVFPDAIGGLSWARKLGLKTVVTVRGNEAIYYFDRSPVRKVVQRALSQFDHVIAVSHDLQEKILADYGVEPSRISVIANGIDTERFRRTDQTAARKACHLEEGVCCLLTVSRLSPEKGLDRLLRAFQRLGRADTRLVVIGDGPLGGELRALCAELGIEQQVDFPGALGHHEICAWYNAADLFCLPSLWEGCPNVIIEALACGTPVVASRVGGIPELVGGAEHGILVPPGEVEALAGALGTALAREWDRGLISQWGSARSWSEVADQVIKVFERVLS